MTTEKAKKPEKYRFSVSLDAHRYLLQILRQPPGKKATGSQIVRGAEVEEMLDDLDHANPRPTPPDGGTEVQCVKCGTLMNNLPQAEADEHRQNLRDWLRKKHTITMTEFQRQACQFVVREWRKAGNMSMARASGELLVALGLDAEDEKE